MILEVGAEGSESEKQIHGSGAQRTGMSPSITQGLLARDLEETLGWQEEPLSEEDQSLQNCRQWFKDKAEGPAYFDAKDQGSIQDLLCLTPTDFLPLLKDQITQASTTGHNTINITFLQRLLWLNKLGNTGCFICLNI